MDPQRNHLTLGRSQDHQEGQDRLSKKRYLKLVAKTPQQQHLPRPEQALMRVTMRSGAACLVALVLAGWGPSSAIAKKHNKLSSCQKLLQYHKDRATSRKLVVVVRGIAGNGGISACVPPRGKVRTVAQWEGRWSGGVVDTAGTWVLFYEEVYDQLGGGGGSLPRMDVRHYKRLLLSDYQCSATAPDDPERDCDGTDYGRAQIAPSGAGAFQLEDYDGYATGLKAFNPAGALTTLADGEVDALRVTRRQIDWTQLGSAHPVPLPK
jgi:hypothetical protein